MVASVGKLNILLVDDHPDGLLTLAAVLDDLGQNLVKTSSAREALRQCLAHDFAVILLDVQMPEMDGFELAMLIRQRERSRHTPIIFLTAAPRSEAQVIRGYAVGAVDYMIKPIVPEILRSKVSVFVQLAITSAEVKRLAETRAALLQDVKRKNLELEHAKERAYRESRFKTRFLANMSHELRTPLNAIIGFSELLEQEIHGPLTPKQREYVANVITSGRHLLDLINDILDISKVEAGRMMLAKEWTSLYEIVETVKGVIGSLAVKQGVALEIDLADDLPDIYIDPIRMKQILYNLLSNAIKFTPSGGSARLTGRAGPDRLHLVVLDTGVGIKGEDLPRLFREFERLDPPAGEKPEGTGLGLVLTRSLIELHGGLISVESEPGKGTAFSVTMPIPGGSGGAAGPPHGDLDPAGSPYRPSEPAPRKGSVRRSKPQ